jgi:hypothetical protein
VRKYLALALIQVLFLAACGGGGGGGGSGSSSSGGTVSACAAATTGNTEPIIVDTGPAALTDAGITSVNVAFISVKVCVPHSSSYQTIDHIQVDTQSSGLRILASALTDITLPYQLDSGGNTMAECLQFADGSSWGSLVIADIQLPTSGENASGVVVQLIGDPAVEAGRPAPTGTAPDTFCNTPSEDTVPTFGANGIIGVGPYVQDCGEACVVGVPLPVYYGCVMPVTGQSSCTAEDATLAQQLTNTVTLFAADNNGTILTLPSVGATGASTVSGSLVLGIGTETNNALPAGVTVLLANADNNAFVSAGLSGGGLTNASYPDSYLDSGSNGTFFVDSVTAIPQCPNTNPPPTYDGFYCPTSTLSFTATVSGTNGTTTPSEMISVANATDLFNANPTFAAFSNLSGTNADPASLDLGLAFFYGRSVYTAVEGVTVAGNPGPFYAF